MALDGLMVRLAFYPKYIVIWACCYTCPQHAYISICNLNHISQGILVDCKVCERLKDCGFRQLKELKILHSFKMCISICFK